MKKVADLRGLRLFGDPTGDEVSFPEVIPPEKSGAVAPSGEEEASAAGKKESETRQKFRALMEGEYKQELPPISTRYLPDVSRSRRVRWRSFALPAPWWKPRQCGTA